MKKGLFSSIRVSSKRDFDRLYREGKRVRFDFYTLIFSPSDRARISFSIPSRFGNAVYRNRRKRLIRNAFFIRRKDLPPYDFLFCLLKKPPSEELEKREIENIFKWIENKLSSES